MIDVKGGKILHITSGDVAGALLTDSGIDGEVFVWHDILYDGPRRPGWPDGSVLEARALFLEQATAGGMNREVILSTLVEQYDRLRAALEYERIVLWFDGCLFDQSMLAHVLACLAYLGREEVELLCIDSYPGIDPFHGLGQLTPEQLSSVYDQRRPVTGEQFRFAKVVDDAFATCDLMQLKMLSAMDAAPLRLVPRAAARWLQEQPDPVTGLGLLESLALEAVADGCTDPLDIYAAVAAADTPPQYWGDITLWAKINSLADRGLLRISGPAARLPQWQSSFELSEFTVTG